MDLPGSCVGSPWLLPGALASHSPDGFIIHLEPSPNLPVAQLRVLSEGLDYELLPALLGEWSRLYSLLQPLPGPGGTHPVGPAPHWKSDVVCEEPLASFRAALLGVLEGMKYDRCSEFLERVHVSESWYLSTDLVELKLIRREGL